MTQTRPAIPAWQRWLRGQSWRQWLHGPKHGTARGIVVFGSPGFRRDAERIADLLAKCPDLRALAAAHGVTLDSHPDSLTRLDSFLHLTSEADRRVLQSEGGLYVGTVMVRHLPGARWHVWPNGHPVVRLASGREVDVVAIVHDRVSAGEARLAALYANATAELRTRSRRAAK